MKVPYLCFFDYLAIVRNGRNLLIYFIKILHDVYEQPVRIKVILFDHIFRFGFP